MNKNIFKILTLGTFLGIGSFVGFLLVDSIYPLNTKRFDDVSTLIYAQNTPIHIFHSQDEKLRIRTTVEEVDPLYLKTLLEREDKYFFSHPGINPFALLRATYQRIRYGHVISGGSTISMQTARLLEPRDRKIISKLIECFRALQLEWHFSKKEILNIYMTLAPFGGNIEGVHAATMAYFQKSAKQLSPSEIALLVALVQSPTRLHPIHYPERAYLARNTLLAFMAKKHLIDEEKIKIYTLADLPSNKRKFPREIPHLAWRLKKQYPNDIKIHTTIDLNLQKKVEFLLSRYQRSLPSQSNTAIFIVEHRKNKPIVYIASRDFYNENNHGFVDYICAFRSPGSTLKPFIFGLGFDLGMIKPESYLLDERRRFGAYYPRNFDKNIQGVVKAEEALALSLNIPVVDLLNRIGVMRFLSLLKEAGVTPQLPRSFESPSLAIALGGLGLSLEQLVSLYSALARDGKVMPLSYLDTEISKAEHSLFSEHAAKQVTNILKVDLESNRHFSLKTGTSYGYRDTWVIAYDQQYVIGIWTGIPDGSPMSPLLARDLVVPLFQKIVAVLPEKEIPVLQKFPPATMTLKKSSQNISDQKSVHKIVPTLIFPVDDTVVELEKQTSQYKPIPLHVTGGKRPYTWLIDGKPLYIGTWKQKEFWMPEKNGYYTITLIDANGQTAKANIELISNQQATSAK